MSLTSSNALSRLLVEKTRQAVTALASGKPYEERIIDSPSRQATVKVCKGKGKDRYILVTCTHKLSLIWAKRALEAPSVRVTYDGHPSNMYVRLRP